MRYANVELIRWCLRCKPFQPFRVVMRTGVRHEIADPEKVAIGKSKVFAFLPRLTEMAESEIDLVYKPLSSKSRSCCVRRSGIVTHKKKEDKNG
jgi:hypothetical protein